MIDTQAELIRIVEYMEANMPSVTWQGVLLQGATAFVVFSVN